MPAGLAYAGGSTSVTSATTCDSWRTWNIQYTATTTSATTTGSNVHIATWPFGGSGSGTVLVTGTNWPFDGTGNGASLTTGHTGISIDVWPTWNQQHTLTAEQIAAREVRLAEQRVAYEARMAEQRQRQLVIDGEKAVARARAEVLLKEHLSAEQMAQLKDKNYFELDTISKNGERRRYRIERKWSGSVHRVDQNGKIIKTLCIHPREATPVEDSMLTQKLMLESGMEEDLLRIANHWN